ncbi:hemin uptake protein HemP [Pseudooceanicola aestuarii]|uniref:hemin uptake protein HemP n=1 Tax=Pseudooceanicola aestuarii TaxID=2697319 RepID=UPI003B830999
MPMTSPQPTPQTTPQPQATDAPPRHIAQNLTEGGQLAHILHGDQTYVLRITRAGKLILTK